MRKGRKLMYGLAMIGLMVVGWGGAAHASGLDLVGMLVQNLGVTNEQAQGGAGAIFNTASQNMSADDFTTVTDALPVVTSLMDAAPSTDSGTGALGSISSALGKSGSSLSSVAGLASTFSNLGMGSDMVGKFIPIVLEYAQSEGGEVVSNLLKAALQ